MQSKHLQFFRSHKYKMKLPCLLAEIFEVENAPSQVSLATAMSSNQPPLTPPPSHHIVVPMQPANQHQHPHQHQQHHSQMVSTPSSAPAQFIVTSNLNLVAGHQNHTAFIQPANPDDSSFMQNKQFHPVVTQHNQIAGNRSTTGFIRFASSIN